MKRLLSVFGFMLLITACMRGLDMPPPDSVFGVYGQIVSPANVEKLGCQFDLYNRLGKLESSIPITDNSFGEMFTVPSGWADYTVQVICPGYEPFRKTVSAGLDVKMITFPGDGDNYEPFDLGKISLVKKGPE